METKNAITAIAPYEPQSLNEAMVLAKTIAASPLLPEMLRNKPENVLVQIMTGHELGLSPMQSIRGIHIINGKPVLGSDLIVALVLRRRDICEHFILKASDDTAATYEAKRVGSQPVTMSFTMAQAQQAGLAGKGNWKGYPAAMLRARCAAALARAVFPDLVAGVYEVDEGEEIRRSARVERVVTPSNVIDLNPAQAAPTPKPAEAIEDAPWEMVERPAAPVEAPAPVDPLDALKSRIAAAESLEALQALVSDIKALPAEAQKNLRAVYSERRAAVGGGK